MAHDVFISYSSKDKPTADAVCAVLEAKGIRCWIAPRDIPFGADWTESIVNALEACKIMVLIFSQHANDSIQIKREVNLAVDNGVTVIPLRVEDIMPSKSLKFSITITHWLDAFPPPLENHLDLLAKSIRGHLSAAAIAQGGSGTESSGVASPVISHAEPSALAAFSLPPTPPPQAYQPPYAQAPPPPPQRNAGILVLMAIVWMVVFFFGSLFVLGAIAGVTHPTDPSGAGQEIGEVMALPLFFISIGVAIWLTIIGKLPGTRKK